MHTPHPTLHATIVPADTPHSRKLLLTNCFTAASMTKKYAVQAERIRKVGLTAVVASLRNKGFSRLN